MSGFCNEPVDHKPYRNNEGKPMFSLLNVEFVEAMAKHLTAIKDKYPDLNGVPSWQRKPHDLKKDVLDSAMRHMMQIYKGEMVDEETGTFHAIASAVNLMFYYYHKHT